MQRNIDGPDAAFVGAREAARWLGVGEEFFERLAEAEDWMRPVWIGTGRRRLKRWAWMDVVVLAHLLAARSAPPAPENNPPE